MNNTMRKAIAMAVIVLGLAGCEAVRDHMYAFTGKEAPPPPRTIEAAQQQFNDASLARGKATAADLQALLGSPAEIKTETGSKVYVYYKNVTTKGVSSDVGTAYVARYTFGRDGKLSDKEYSARPMSSGLGG